MSEQEKFAEWCIVEIMGHRKVAGKTSERMIAGRGFLQVDIPISSEEFLTQFYAPESIFAIHPTSEEIIRNMDDLRTESPISPFTLDAMIKSRQMRLKEGEDIF